MQYEKSIIIPIIQIKGGILDKISKLPCLL